MKAAGMGNYITYLSPSNDCSEQNASNCDKAADIHIGPKADC